MTGASEILALPEGRGGGGLTHAMIFWSHIPSNILSTDHLSVHKWVKEQGQQCELDHAPFTVHFVFCWCFISRLVFRKS